MKKSLLSIVPVILLIIGPMILHRSYGQTNDDCADALPVVIGQECSFSENTNELATSEDAEISAPDPSCGVYRGGDVWFTFTMPASGSIRIETDNLGGATPHSFVLYSGTCGNFTEIQCIQLDSKKTIFHPELAGQTLYLRMFSYAGLGGSPFNLCIWEPEIPVNDNCESAIPVKVGESCDAKLFTNAYAATMPVSTIPEPSCGHFQGGDVWFKTTIPASGNLRVETRNLNVPVPLSVTMYTGSCSSLNEIFCIQLDEAWSFSDLSLAGDSVYIRVFSYNSEEGVEFEMCLYSFDEPINDNCADALEIEVSEECNFNTYSNALSTPESSSVAPDPSCGFFRGSDVWFKTVMPPSGNIRIENRNLAGVNAHSMTVYSGSCGSMNEEFCTQLEEKFTFSSSDLAGQNIFLRVFTYNNEEGGPFEICMYEPTCRDTIIDVGTVNLCEGESYRFGNRELTTAGSYSENFESAGGCDSLVNLTISIEPVYELEEKINICPGDSYTYPDGTIHEQILLKESHTSHLLTSQGCDSIIVTSLEIPEISNIILQSGSILTAEEDSADYQWYNCSDISIPLAGKTERNLNGMPGNEYAVLITKEGCSLWSECAGIEVVGLEMPEDKEIKIFPNPVSEVLNIELGKMDPDTWLEIRSLTGQDSGLKYKLSNSNAEVDLRDLPSGLYLLQLKSNRKSYKIKFIKR